MGGIVFTLLCVVKLGRLMLVLGATHMTTTARNHVLVAARASQIRQSPALGRAKYLIHMGWLMGLEPTTTGITILIF
ncbi:MAG: hypothetical protein Q7U52_12095 [Hydrogenophaga sp.]|uniref:hypothetical protein n=1 Tax=Hydrogenophaga sp. TaxID=1904254 RepID=UPI00272261A2|nr:hypothetical protein [Hydrogenophaga sp.]MDO9148379.1 hypothetical protein [Hydrogenophaga sp.]MDO9605120.1 hypothetical protein [Hydrogenophaga sp.]